MIQSRRTRSPFDPRALIDPIWLRWGRLFGWNSRRRTLLPLAGDTCRQPLRAGPYREKVFLNNEVLGYDYIQLDITEEARPVERPNLDQTEAGDGVSILRRLKSRQMLLLIALHEVKSLRKAAAMLNMTQPTATKLLQDLEHNIGLPLFDRGRRGMQPTNYGDVMIRHARLVLADLNRTRLELEALSSGATGQIKIGAVISAIPFLLARAVAKLKRQHPRLFVSIDVGTSDALVPALAKGELDVLLARPLCARRPARTTTRN